MSQREWLVADIGGNSALDVRSLFQRVFGHPMSAELWNWKYGSGRGVGVGAWSPEGELLAHYGGTYREIFLGGRPVRAVHIGDVMVAAEGRAALSHKGPFGLVTEGFFKRHVGVDSGSALGFGFPNDRHMRLGERLGHYTRTGGIVELNWHCSMGHDFVLEPVNWADANCEAEIDTLWFDMQAELVDFAAPARTGAWFRHRYANHPEHDYRCAWVRRSDGSDRKGVVVLRRTSAGLDSLNEAQWELMDWITTSPESSPLMVAAAREMASAGGGVDLKLWCSDAVAQWLDCTSPSSTSVCAAAVTLPNSAPPHLKWWLTGGDTDFR
ncbi:MAG: hypothetical protein CFE43_07020 [Burkholderiales bacterium PBB3]|nr:MAG: hypothetical protein CFE43_07020 [Burkholderiales bacterium PBB3]